MCYLSEYVAVDNDIYILNYSTFPLFTHYEFIRIKRDPDFAGGLARSVFDQEREAFLENLNHRIQAIKDIFSREKRGTSMSWNSIDGFDPEAPPT